MLIILSLFFHLYFFQLAKLLRNQMLPKKLTIEHLIILESVLGMKNLPNGIQSSEKPDITHIK